MNFYLETEVTELLKREKRSLPVCGRGGRDGSMQTAKPPNV